MGLGMSRERIVVGVDGSAASVAALRWAVASSRWLGLPVEALFVTPGDQQRKAGELDPEVVLTGVVDVALTPAQRRAGLSVSRQVVAGSPAEVLVERSQQASLLVLGRSQGRDPLHVSTTSRCLRHAACPVGVVPATLPEPGVSGDGERTATAYGTVGDRRVGEVMRPQVLGIDATAGADVGLQMMVGAGVHHLPVMEHGRCIGLLYEADVVWHLARWALLDTIPTAGDLASRPPPHVSVDQTVREAAAEIASSTGDVVLVTDQDRVVGSLTADDLVSLVAQESSGDGSTATGRRVSVRSGSPATLSDERPSAVVVGVDGSDAAKRALAWAVCFAAHAGSSVHAVSVCALVPPSPFLGLPGTPDDIDVVAQGHREMLADAVREADPDRYGVRVQTSVVHGEPGRALCSLAAGALAVVVGSHGRGAVLSSLLGSVSAYCVRHAECPAFVIPPRAADAVEARFRARSGQRSRT